MRLSSDRGDQSFEVNGQGKGPTLASRPCLARLPRAERRRRRRRADARRKGSELRLTQEQLESRIALAVYVSGYEATQDFFETGNRIAGRAIIASDDGSDVYLRQVASVTQDLQVSTNSSFLGYSIIDDISEGPNPAVYDDRFQQIFVTNGTRRLEAGPLVADYDAAASRVTTFMLDHEEVAFQGGLFIGPAITGTLRYTQFDGTPSVWTFGPGLVGFGGPGFTSTLPAGHVRPTAIEGVDVNVFGDIGQSALVVTWSDSLSPRGEPTLVSATYATSDDFFGFGVVQTLDSPGAVGRAASGQAVRITIPGALATQQDGISLRQSLGIIPGTLTIGTLSFAWGGSVGGNLLVRDIEVYADGIARFGGNRSARINAPTGGLIDVRGRLVDGGIMEFQFRRWSETSDVDDAPLGTFRYDDSDAIPFVGGASNVTLADVEYLTYTRETEPNSVTIMPGQTLTRGLTIDLLTPGSTINIGSPVAVTTEWIESTGSPPPEIRQQEDIDLRATNINIQATMTSPDRLSIGRSQIARERLSIPPDYNNPSLPTPSVPSLYEALGTGFPPVRTGQALVHVNAEGRVVSLEPLPGFEGFGYDRDQPPVVTIDPPPSGGTRATARAVVAPDGRLTGYVITDPGAGYQRLPAGTRPRASIADAIPQAAARARVAGIDAATGQVTTIDVLDKGYRYHAPPRVIVAPPSGDGFGVQATARAVLDGEGRVERIEVVEPGWGYRQRPLVTLAEPSPPAMAERVLVEAAINADVYELYVGDDFATDAPRGLMVLNSNGSFATTPVSVQVQGFTPGANPAEDPISLTLTAGGGGVLPPGFNPAGSVISGFGITEGTRVLSWNPLTTTATVPAGSINLSTTPPISASISVGAKSLYLEATKADFIVEGLVNVEAQSYLFNSAAADEYLSPFRFTTRSPVTGTHTGTIEGSVVDIVLGNHASPPVTGSTAFHEADLRTSIGSLRVKASESEDDPQGPFPYRLTIEDQGSIRIDGLVASSGPITVRAASEIEIAGVVDTHGDVALEANAVDGGASRLRVTAPLRTRFGRISLEADTVEMRNAMAVTAAAVEPGRRDISVDARGGNIVLQGEVYAVNDIFLEQVNRVDQFDRVQVTTARQVANGDDFQEVVLARPTGGQLPVTFDPVGVTLVSQQFLPNGATIIRWNPVTSTAAVALVNGGAAVPPGGAPFVAGLSRTISSIVPGEIDGSLARVIGNELFVLAAGEATLRTNVNRMTASAGSGFSLSETDDIAIPLLTSGGLVSLEALGVDRGPTGQNPVALSATLLDVTNLVVNTPNGSARIDANTDKQLVVGDAEQIWRLGDRAQPMRAAGDVIIRSQSGDVTLLDAPIAGRNAYAVRVATSSKLPDTATYLPGIPGTRPSELSGAGSLNALAESFWGRDAAGQPIRLAVGDLVLIKDQPKARTQGALDVDHTRENGIYRVAGLGGGTFGSPRWRLVRSADADTAAEMPDGKLVRVLEGTHADTIFRIDYDSIVPTLVERVGTNQLQFPVLFPEFELLEVGMIVNGTGIAPDSYITAIDPVARIVTLDVVDPGQVFELTFGSPASPSIPVVSTTDDTMQLGGLSASDWAKLQVGQEVVGAGIVPGSVITRIDPSAGEIDVAETLLGPAVVELVGSELSFDPLLTDPVFTLFPQLKPGQQVQLYDAEAELLGTRSIVSVNAASRSVRLDAGVAGVVRTARIWTPRALPTPIAPLPLVSAGLSSVIVAADDRLANVRVGQRFQLRNAAGASVGAARNVVSVVIRVDAVGDVRENVTIGFASLLTAAERAALVGGRIEFLAPAAISLGVAEPGAVPVDWNTWAAEEIEGGGDATSRSVPIESGPGDEARSPISGIPSGAVVVPVAGIAAGAATTTIRLPAGSSAWFDSAVVGQTVQFLLGNGALMTPAVDPLLFGAGTAVGVLDPTTTWLETAVVGQSVQFLDAGNAVIGTAAIVAITEAASVVEFSDLIPVATATLRRLNTATISRLDQATSTVTLAEPTPDGAALARLLMNAAPLLRGVGTPVAAIAPYSPLFAVAEVGHAVEVLDAAGFQVLGTATILSLDPVSGSVALSAAIPAGGGLLRDRHVVAMTANSDFVENAQIGDTVEFLDIYGTVLPGVGAIDTILEDEGFVILDVPVPAGTTQLRLPNVAAISPNSRFFEAAEVGLPVDFYDTTGGSIPAASPPIEIVDIDTETGWVRFDAAVPALAAAVAFEQPADVAVIAADDAFFAVAEIGGQVQFLDAAGVPVGIPLVIGQLDSVRGFIRFTTAIPLGAASLQLLGDEGSASLVVRLPNYDDFSQLAVGLDVSGPNISSGTVITALDPEARTITLSQAALGPVSYVRFGVATTSRYPEADTLVVTPEFTNWQRLFVGQRVYGAGIEDGAVIVAIDRAAETIRLTPKSIGSERETRVTLASAAASPYYPEQFDDWIEIDHTFNEFFELKVGQRVQLLDADGNVMRLATVTAIDPAYRTIGLENGSLNGLEREVEGARFLSPSSVRFGVIDGVGSTIPDFLLQPVGLAPMTIREQVVRTNIGSDLTGREVTFVVSTDGRVNDVAGSLGKMIDVSQLNDTRLTQVDVGVRSITRNDDGTWMLEIDPLFTAYDRLRDIEDLWSQASVSGTPRMFTGAARVSTIDQSARTVTLVADSLSALAVEDLLRVTYVTLPIQSVNVEQDSGIEFWNWTTGTIQLTQELPTIVSAIPIDGTRVNLSGGQFLPLTAAGNQPPRRFAGVFIDGQRITRTELGALVVAGTQVNGLSVVGDGADGTRLANLSLGGFQRGSGILIDGASDVLVEGVTVGRSPSGARIPSTRGITVRGAEEDPATGNTILNSTVVAGTSSGIALDAGAIGTTIVGGSIGTQAIDNQVGIFVAEGATNTRVGVDPIQPQGPAVAVSASLVAGATKIRVPNTLFGTPLLGLGVVGDGISAGTTIIGIDSAANEVHLSQAIAATRTSTVRIGHVATRRNVVSDSDGTATHLLDVPGSVRVEDLFIGQAVAGTGIPTGTIILAVNGAGRQVRVSQPFTFDGTDIVSFGAAPRTVVQNNRRGIVLRGESSRVTNTDVINNTINGIEVVTAGQQIGATPVLAEISDAGDGITLASWPTLASIRKDNSFLTLPSTFSGGSAVTAGSPVYGPGIAPGTLVTSIVPPTGTVRTWRVNLSKAVTSTVSSATISFGVMKDGSPRRILIDAASRAGLVVGQAMHGTGVPEFSSVVALRIGAGADVDHITISAPRAGLADPTFAALAAAEVLFASRSTTSNRFNGNGQYGISVQHGAGEAGDGSPTRIVANYFGMLGEQTLGDGNRVGPIQFQNWAAVPEAYQPGTYDRVDRRANRYDLARDPGSDLSTPPRPGSGDGIDPLPPRDPVL